MESTKQISNSDILWAVESWIITLSELAWAVKTRLNNTLVWDLPLEALPLIKKFKTPPHNAKTERFWVVEEYINNINQLRNNSNKLTLQEINWITYLVLWQDDIFEVKKQKWPIYIAYHPIKDMYIVYKFLWEDSDQNTRLLWWLNRIDETEIGWYYFTEFAEKKEPLRLQDIQSWIVHELDLWVDTEVGYYYIWENWETKYFWDFRRVWDLKKHWNAVFFSWKTTDYYNELVIHNLDKVIEIPDWFENARKSKSGRNLLHILYNFPWNNSTNSLVDLDQMEFIFEWANRFNFKISLPENDVWTFEDEISWEFHEKRKWMARIFWKKVTRNNTTL